MSGVVRVCVTVCLSVSAYELHSGTWAIGHMSLEYQRSYIKVIVSRSRSKQVSVSCSWVVCLSWKAMLLLSGTVSCRATATYTTSQRAASTTVWKLKTLVTRQDTQRPDHSCTRVKNRSLIEIKVNSKCILSIYGQFRHLLVFRRRHACTQKQPEYGYETLHGQSSFAEIANCICTTSYQY